MKYHARSCGSHGTVIINISNILIIVSNSSQVARLGKRSEDPPWHSGHYSTDIAEFGPMPTTFVFIVAHLHREVTPMN